ncbi:predicted protein [Chaetoceros tenuissimus]|uniref:MYND-type domain-containing protein n=1 Tax=Chaetoceros tenuissimus TaxID=426638 RepID=A0AAD3DBZ8_9STRA|nr:predicted protein [Chaetoceros tenuissimus]
MIEADQKINRNFPTDQGSNFFLFSIIDELRFDILDHGANEYDLFECARGNCDSMLSSKCDPLPFGEAYLATAILCYYATFYEKCSSSEVEEHCIDAMTKYFDFKSSQLSDSCCTCHESDEDRLMVCQGCRVVSFCCKDCQRLNFFHHEETGIRGMGHKYLCPVFKAYNKRNKDTDDSKKDHLDRKFRRACKTFSIGTLQNVDEKRVKCLVAFTTVDKD